MVDTENERVFANRTKEEIKNAPEYDPDTAMTEDYRGSLSAHYGGQPMPTSTSAPRHDTF